MRFRTSLTVLLAVTGVGCASQKPARSVQQPTTMPSGLGGLVAVPAVDAACVPPVGWTARPLKRSNNHTHQVWLSPSGNTAYGVIRFALPLPVGADIVLYFFLREMRASEGEARLISKRRDPHLRGLRFVAEGGLYVVRANLTTRGFRGWAIYAGTLRGRDILPNELALAELARENTQTGVDGNSRSDKP